MCFGNRTQRTSNPPFSEVLTAEPCPLTPMHGQVLPIEGNFTNYLPTVGAEGAGGDAFLVVEVGFRGVHGEAVANGDWLEYVR